MTTGPMLAAVTVESGEGYAQSIGAGKHALVSDEPPTMGGADSGPAPYQLLLSALGSCTGITLQMYAKRKGWDLGKVTVRLKFLREGEAEKIERTLEIGGTLDAQQR